ncbi:tetraspanin-8 [Spinacia oleracea]|uniref:Tetraspanin-8 n=1 Tax=Spinacia oleracea TaxID=3562 RepID=A0A9R0IUN1_SPIOL|nr:tetraspanin-8 [Spinacia oleracea]
MAKLSNILITALNILTTIISLIAIAIFIYLHFFINGSPTHCQQMVEWPILIVGLILLTISLLGMIGSWCRITSLLWIYIVAVVGIMIGWCIFSVFVFMVTNKGAGKAVSGVGFEEYRVGDFNHWLQKHVVNGNNWVQIRSCLVDTKICGSLDRVYTNDGADFLKNNLSPIQSSCCKPPTSCGFTPKNATNWEVPKSGPASSDTDCSTWNNEQNKLCYDCKSCKAGVLANLRMEWRHFLIFNLIVILILFVIYMIGCCAVRNNYTPSSIHKYP